ncbi:MAG: putative sulfate exporter family transporter, partial [Gemmatimonadota bacterium]|nr:putative sulfate exporter family transporter [Gemmatimonadota bacterium]
MRTAGERGGEQEVLQHGARGRREQAPCAAGVRAGTFPRLHPSRAPPPLPRSLLAPRLLFWLLAAFTLTPWASPALALALGAALALTLGNPFPKRTARTSRWLLQGCVVGLGFGMSLGSVLAAGATGVAATVVVIVGALALGLVMGRWLRVDADTSLLISAGTSICGGSAIAAVGPAIGARDESMSVALATVFVLNAVALVIFPPLGRLLGLDEAQFALWAAVAIHDTSSVVGAATEYGPASLAAATVLKLARALWIVPL